MLFGTKKRRVGDTAIVVVDGKIYARTGVDDSEWLKILEACAELEQAENGIKEIELREILIDLLVPERLEQRRKDEEEKKKAIEEAQLELDFDKRMENAKKIADISGLFEYDKDGFPYLKGFNIPMPKILVEALLDAHYNPESNFTVTSLVNFWKYLVLNPDKHVRSGLFKWVKSGNFAITEEGNIISYRNVNVKTPGKDSEFENFVAEEWAKVKKWKKLKADIEKNGIINPLICTEKDGKYRLCMGMRRFIAGCMLGIEEYEIEIVPDEEVKTLMDATAKYQTKHKDGTEIAL